MIVCSREQSESRDNVVLDSPESLMRCRNASAFGDACRGAVLEIIRYVDVEALAAVGKPWTSNKEKSSSES
jgi:hypothetical protein